jgi:hypothetical protein
MGVIHFNNAPGNPFNPRSKSVDSLLRTRLAGTALPCPHLSCFTIFAYAGAQARATDYRLTGAQQILCVPK